MQLSAGQTWIEILLLRCLFLTYNDFRNIICEYENEKLSPSKNKLVVMSQMTFLGPPL